MEHVEDTSVALEDKVGEVKETELSPLLYFVKERYNTARDARLPHETVWLKSYKNFKGVYDQDSQFLKTEKSKVFIKLTKTKVLAAYGQIIDLLYSDGKLPITIDPTTLPEGIEDTVHVDGQNPGGSNQGGGGSPAPDMGGQGAPGGGASPSMVEPYDLGLGYPGDGNDLKPGEGLLSRIGSYLSSKLKGADIQRGPGQKPTDVTFHPAKLAAKRMEKKIHDQLEEAQAAIHIRKVLLESCIFGTGVLKGPLTFTKEYPKWDLGGIYAPVLRDMPKVSATSLWNVYVDPEATCKEDAAFMVERHPMTASQLRELKRRPFFRKEHIEKAIKDGPNAERLHWENVVNPSRGIETLRYEVLEYWGTVDADEFKEAYNLPIPPELKDEVEFQVNIWICGNHILRMVLNPFTPRRIPYYFLPFEVDPYGIWGIGMAENMMDSQMLMNGFLRMAVDNAALSGHLILEMDESLLVAGQSKELYPGKVFKRQGGQIGASIHAIEFPNTTNQTMILFDKARQLADESTGLPSIAHGQSGVYGGPGRTASGMSMFMGAASVNIKTVIKNIDDYVLQPLGEALFAWNMQFDFDPLASGDLEVKARGTSSLVQKEMRVQKLMQFMQIAAGNPATMAYVKFPTLLREIADALDIDADKLLNNPEEAQLFAQLMGNMGMGGPNMQGTPPGMPGPMEMGGGVPGPMGASGAPPAPGMEGFTGNQPAQPEGGPMMPPGMPPMGK